jgi:RHS repeat-associated protein
MVLAIPSSLALRGTNWRTETTVATTTTEYVLDVAGGLPEVIVATTDGASTPYVQIQGQVLAQYDSGTWAYVAPDALGSVRQLADTDGHVTLAQHYDPFGNLLEAAGQGASEFGYTGEWWDRYMNLLFLRARYYDPGVGRFVSKDLWMGSELRPQSMNGWSYTDANPVNLTDPAGSCPPSICRDEYGPVDPYYQSCSYWDVGCSAHYQSSGIPAPTQYYGYNPTRDPLTREQWELSKLEARRFQIPVELVAGTVAVEIIHDTDLTDPAKDWVNAYLLFLHLQGNRCATGILRVLDDYRGLGPGPGVTNFHTGAAKQVETYFQTYYPENALLEPLQDDYIRQLILLSDESNIRYAAAYLKMVADVRKGSGMRYALHSHLSDLTDVDMQIIYGAFRAGIRSWGEPIPDAYQQANTPGYFGSQIRRWLHFYRVKARENQKGEQ